MKLCITGGGTGGHLMIADALAHKALENGYEVIFIGSTNGQDRKYFEGASNFSHVYFLKTSGVVNQKGFAKVKALWNIFRAFLASREILKKHKIDATYSVGGFSAAAASFATLSLRIPLFMHEQNAIRGRLNSLLKPYAKRFISAYDKDSPIKGYPVKDVFFKSQRVRESLKSIIFLGGSHGAKAINDLALSVAKELEGRGIKIIHQAGESDYERVKKEYEILGIEVELYGFTKDLDKLIARADLAVSRAGASTLWELSANGLPALFVPYPHAASDHQYHNASFIVKNELGWCQREGDGLREKLLNILDEELAQKSKKLMECSIDGVADLMIKDIKEALR
ncbi:MAG: undecaprenyldiphospho-muramoylpentapeptide beta-N-acetylglucosaminyltransferase [Sulfurimonas sp.]|uniref:undecaprenyldiphospho-muramoylpentapeptide beta-N-acetylglucosaminyltransferase n=1 Tax=Sulfurimonas sp. TaxID=2022749 RepID=UPI0025DD582E|nr:undecaprenyldiphospho-muramoylpentapeptide beta-N-acetylglucosaminyltransferase [Sulfurimonas sp.]MCK9492449.1 undecaprenyldiphospho-muramoylpentapeptide beta-N-acetylglucosaminyltransferase [Sulfurimonas sp.]